MAKACTGIILFAHGSRDPAWRRPVQAVAQWIADNADSTTLVECAYLELCDPDLPTAAHQLVRQGAQHIRVLPVFFGMGKHAREDLPQLVAQLRLDHPQVQFEQLAAAGEHPAMTRLLAELALGTVPGPAGGATSSPDTNTATDLSG